MKNNFIKIYYTYIPIMEAAITAIIKSTQSDTITRTGQIGGVEYVDVEKSVELEVVELDDMFAVENNVDPYVVCVVEESELCAVC